MKLEKISKAFYNAICHSSTCCDVDCACGRVHFVSHINSRGSYEEGEYEKLLERHKEHPDKYIKESEFDSISYGNVNGEQIVIDCPCKKDVKIEEWIWSHRAIISAYFGEKLVEVKKEHEAKGERLEKDIEVFNESKEL